MNAINPNPEPGDSASNARRKYVSPEQLMTDQELSDEEKLALLQDWDLELDNRLRAEEEGMSASDPMRSRHEAQLADESARVKDALKEMTPSDPLPEGK